MKNNIDRSSPERPRHWYSCITPFNGAMFVVILLTGAMSVGALQSQVTTNTKTIDASKKEMSQAIKESEQRVREDLKELRKIIINDIRRRTAHDR